MSLRPNRKSLTVRVMRGVLKTLSRSIYKVWEQRKSIVDGNDAHGRLRSTSQVARNSSYATSTAELGAVHYRILNESGEVTQEELPEEILKQLPLLPYNPASYFDIDLDGTNIALDLLISSRARPQGILNAGFLMKKAADGLQPKRKPISVSAREDGAYVVNDGNSTLMNARISGWPDIPCKIV